MNAGALRHLVSIVNETITPDGMGGGLRVDTVLATVRADITPTGGRERFGGMQMQSETTHLVKIRFRPGVLPKQIIVWGSRRFEIESVVNSKEQNFLLLLACREQFPEAR
jgi:SPP1 family predicted phage head-tail adaptor